MASWQLLEHMETAGKFLAHFQTKKVADVIRARVCVCVCVALAEHVSRGPLTAATRRSHYGSTKHQSASVFRIHESGCDTSSSTATRWISNFFYFLVRMNDAVCPLLPNAKYCVSVYITVHY